MQCRSIARPATSSTRLTASRVQPRPFAPASLRPQQSRSPVACQGLFGLGLPEIAVIAGIAALVFGPSKLPELGKGLGQTVKSFQTAAKEFEQELKAATKEDEAKPGEAKPAATEDKPKQP